MHLTHRATIGRFLQSDINKHIQECVQQGTGEGTPQDLDRLRLLTESWIKEKTAYAIFSHRWLDQGELTFQDISKFAQLSAGGFIELIAKSDCTIRGNTDILNQVISLTVNKADNTPDASFKLLLAMEQLCKEFLYQEREDCQGFMELVQFCTISLRYNCHYVWFDTGCIDKSSSAELEESIRSMFNWYRNSHICIVHLAKTEDVMSLRGDPWFTRGWTLQELLAPKRVKFYSKSWQPITNSKSLDDKHSNKHPLWHHISDITAIPHERIFNFKPGVHHARDSFVWLSKRRTTRIEDMAYCLIGLLDIPLSIAYGEGEKAFYRLQVEILERTPDMGLFVWQGQPATDNSMLAAGPHCFSSLALQPLYTRTPTDNVDQSWSFTCHGLRIPLSVYLINSGRWRITDMLGNPEITLDMKTERKDRYITMELKTLEYYESVELAVLGKVEDQLSGQKNSLAILLGFKDGQWKRIAREHIILSCPIKTVWQTRFIQ